MERQGIELAEAAVRAHVVVVEQDRVTGFGRDGQAAAVPIAPPVVRLPHAKSVRVAI